MELYLLGEANDYVGKGLAGAKIVIRQVNPNVLSTVAVMGNTCLYGATSGRLYANGIAGDRFAARNSGVVAVIEGLASNGCEYMTGGAVAVLGSIEQNFGAGMTGGVCYIWDNIADVEENLNDDVELLSAASLAETYEIHQEFVRNLISRHYQETHSVRAAQFMADFESNFAELIIIKPRNISLQNLTNYLIK
jgi:glutamate synthase (NADPH/NADH) large chain